MPPLENGDHLTRQEFERRYQAATHLKKAELIEGVVYVPAALRFKSHAEPHGSLTGWLWYYTMATPGVEIGVEPTIRLDADNEPQPDVVLRLPEWAGGQSRIAPDDYIEGAPELVAEIAASSAAIDLNDKLNAYRRNSVQEYLVWQVFEQRLDWFRLHEGRFQPLTPDADGIIRSQVFPGLWLAVSALLEKQTTQLLAVAQAGLAASAHQQFVQHLASQPPLGND
ncbi:MAG: Uma2 family endonuclease [Leptolyngbyaceae cyanobacterium]